MAAQLLSLPYLTALALTLATEVPTVTWLLRRAPWQRVVPAVLVANLISHPALHFLLPRVLPVHPLSQFIVMGELLVLALEALVYLLWIRPRPWPLALAASALANAASFGLGLLLLPGTG